MTNHSTGNQNTPSINESLLLFLLAAVNFTHIMDFVVMAPLNPFLRDALQITTKQFSLVQASYAISAGVAGIVSSFFIDKLDRRTNMLILFAGFTISNLACALAQDYNSLMASRILAGAFGGVLGSLILSIIGDAIPQERRGKATGIVMAAFSAASVIGIPIGVALANAYQNWHAPFYMLTILSALIFVVLLIKMPSLTGHMNKGNNESTLVRIKNILLIPNVRWAFLFISLLMIAGLTVVPNLSDYFVKNGGLSKDRLWLIYVCGGLATVISGPVTGALSDKFGKQRVFVIAAIISIIPIYLVTTIGNSPEWILFTISTSFFIFFGARFVPAMAMMTSSVEIKHRGSFMSINSSVQQFSSSLAILIGGFIIANANDGSLLNFNICGLIAIAATIACVMVSYKVKQLS